MNKRFVIFLAAVIVLFVGIVVYTKTQKENASAEQTSNNVYGKLDSKVTLTEYVDFQCEGCYAYYPTVKEVKEKYKDRVKFQIKNFPLTASHPHAKRAAAYAEAAARQGKFFEMHDKIFEGQKIWETAGDPETHFKRYATEIGLDMERLANDIKDPAVSAVINADIREAKSIGSTGTPTFALNGTRVENVDNSVEAISKLLDDALKSAE